MPSFSELLEAALEAAGISARELARITDCSVGAVSEARNGKDAPSDEMAHKLAKALNISEGKKLDQWLLEAARQRARRADITARAGERRLAQKLDELEALLRADAAIFAEVANHLPPPLAKKLRSLKERVDALLG